MAGDKTECQKFIKSYIQNILKEYDDAYDEEEIKQAQEEKA